MRERDLLREFLAPASVAVGVSHGLAFRDHTHHALIAAFFVAIAVAQVGWAFALVLWPNVRAVLYAGVLLNASVAGTWVISRTTGLPFIPGAEEVESIGALDAVTTVFEVAIVAGLLHILIARPNRARWFPHEVATGALAFGLALIALPGALGTPIGGHSHGGEHGAHAHGALAAGHEHDEGGEHAHAKDESHGHDEVHVAGASHASHTGSDAHAHGTSQTPHPHGSAHPDGTAAPHSNHDSAKKPAGVPLPKPRGLKAIVRYGPFDVPASSSDGTPGMVSPIQTMLTPPCRNCYLTSIKPDLVFENGADANYNTGVMLHHVVIGDSGEPDVTCGREGVGAIFGRRFFAAGNERTRFTLQSPFAYFVDATDWWTGNFELMNFTKSRKSVYLELEVHHLPATDSSVKRVTPVWMDMDNCADSQYSIPAGPRTDTWNWKSTITGRVVWAGGHVHNWGRKIALSNPDAGQTMCKSVAGYGSDPAYKGNIDSMSVCAWDRLGTVRSGQRLQIAASYDSPQARSDVMGIMVAYVYETSDLGGGSKAPEAMTDPPDGGPPKDPSDEHQH